uniref:Uncharacterized protein n=1 Tax=Magallana gigas TaxID=29159 RepID=K1PA31_MAGGI
MPGPGHAQPDGYPPIIRVQGGSGGVREREKSISPSGDWVFEVLTIHATAGCHPRSSPTHQNAISNFNTLDLKQIMNKMLF